LAKEERNVPAAEENKAIFRRYIEEVPNKGNLEIADEIFERYAPTSLTGRRSSAVSRTSSGSPRSIAQPSPTGASALRSRSQKGTR
jgi:hypothetical protein